MRRILDSASVEACARTFSARIRRRREEAARRAESLRRLAEEAARALGRDFGARSVWLFGSLAWGVAHEASDVDLLVEGLAHDDWAEATRVVESIVGAPVDLVRAEEAAPGLLERTRAEGRALPIGS